MSETNWQKKHQEVMELELKKSQLHQELETLETQKRELVSTIATLRKEVFVHSGDYETVTQERVKTVDYLDEKFIELTENNEEQTLEQTSLSKRLSNLHNSLSLIDGQTSKGKVEKEELNKEIEVLTSSLDKLKLENQEETEKRRVEVRELNEELSESKEGLRVTKVELETRKADILKEERILSIRRSDLQIYEARMRKKYPNKTFVLKDL